ncbi:9138_t:CDS:2 [Paraglomus occultum]|uniref:9138_t:CDS:1 n=1 Tax=Paraglomus occultum TaxID=144539 RepID=A0A9N9GJR4_9GLOM|nr:9138_t:CDS:2 [Paraglomus occultum]
MAQLQDYFTWKIVSHRDAVPIFEIFEEKCPQSFNSQTTNELSIEVNVVKEEKKDDKFIALLPSIPNIQGSIQGAVLTACYITQQTMQQMQQIGSKIRKDCMMFATHLHKNDTISNTNITDVCISA